VHDIAVQQEGDATADSWALHSGAESWVGTKAITSVRLSATGLREQVSSRKSAWLKKDPTLVKTKVKLTDPYGGLQLTESSEIRYSILRAPWPE
jgi:hypothetical protein